jgi:hypothetical protein
MSFYTAIGVSLSFLSAIWIPATLLCCIPWVQKRECCLATIRVAHQLMKHRDAIPALGDVFPGKMADRA